MKQIRVNGTLNEEDLKKVNELSKSEPFILVFPNTRLQSIDIINRINDKIKISIQGGLNPRKQKFNNYHYQERTYYTVRETVEIMKFFEKIERQINPKWTETQKCMFVYNTLCNHMHYKTDDEPSIENGRDVVRNLLGVLSTKAVCSGFAIIFKEAMDRLGIECEYQNRESHHSWNVVKLDGTYRALDLTWDVNDKKNGKCGFYYFGRDKNFYSNKHHDLSKETEENIYPIKEFNIEELKRDYSVITQNRFLNYKVENITNIEGNNMKISSIGTKNGLTRYFVLFDDSIPHLISVPANTVPSNITRESVLQTEIGKTYIRNDGSSFIIYKTGAMSERANDYMFFEYRGNANSIIGTHIFSESNLINPESEMESIIANRLLSKERVGRKINGFNGYVGYVSGNSLFYNQEYEKETLNIVR